MSRKGLRPTRFNNVENFWTHHHTTEILSMVYVYVIQSELDGGLYIGMSGNLRRRFLEHQNGESRSTMGRRPWKLIYYEAYIEEQDAEGREIFLKSGSVRRFLDKQLKNHFSRFPRREDT
jgi:putative endonuclease